MGSEREARPRRPRRIWTRAEARGGNGRPSHGVGTQIAQDWLVFQGTSLSSSRVFVREEKGPLMLSQRGDRPVTNCVRELPPTPPPVCAQRHVPKVDIKTPALKQSKKGFS